MVQKRTFWLKSPKLDPKKANMEDDIPTKTLIRTNDIVGKYLSTIYNNSKDSGTFPGPLKIADVTPIPKTKEKTLFNQYRPVSLIPRNMSDQIFAYVQNFLSPYPFWV